MPVVPRRSLVLAIILLSTLTFPLTITGASLALPDIQSDLDSGLAATQWVVNGYNASFAGFLVLTGSLADVFGRRRVFAAGVALFCVTGLTAAVLDDIALLNAVRVLGGIGAAAAVSAAGSILAVTFSGPARARAFGLLGTVLGAGLAFGPTIGGLLVSALGWRGVFLVPGAFAAVVLSLTWLLPKASGAPGRRVDWAGGVLFTTALLLLITVMVQGPEWGFGSPLIIAGFAAAAMLAVAFTLVERRQPDPMFDLGLLVNPQFRSCVIAAGAIVVVLVPLLVYLPSYLIAVVELDAGAAGIWLLMLTVPTVVLPTVGAALSKRMPTVVLMAGSVAVTGAGCLLLVTIGPDSTPLGLLGPLALIGSGFGLSTGLLDGMAITSVPVRQSGMASGIFNSSRLASETVGIAAVGAVLAALSGGRLSGPSYTSALHTVCLALGAFAAAATVLLIVLSLRTTRRREPPWPRDAPRPAGPSHRPASDQPASLGQEPDPWVAPTARY